MEYIKPYLDYFSAHPDWAIAIIFLIAFGEALLIIGLFVPSTAVLVGAGILVGTGHLPFWPVLIATTIGAIAGDQVSFWAGRLFGERLKTMWPLNRYPQLVAKGEDYVRSHGGKSIALGRFVPGVKAVVPGIVGMFGMSELFFLSVNVVSGTVWAAAHVLPGILIGQGLAFAEELSGRLVVVLLILLFVIAVAGYLIRMTAALLSPFMAHALKRISVWARSHNNHAMRRFGRAIAPHNPRSVSIVLFVAVFVAGLIALVEVLLGQVRATAVSNADASVFNLMHEMRNAPADELMIMVTMLGDAVVMIPVALSMVFWLLWRKSYRAAAAVLVTVLVGMLSVPVIKHLVARPRPEGLFLGNSESFSFPSSHAVLAAMVLGVLAVLVSHWMGRWTRSLAYATAGAMAVVIGCSRVYLGAHWLSDVVAGLLFGTVMTAAFAVVIETIPPRRIRPLGLLAVSLMTFVVVGALNIRMNYDRQEDFYVPALKVQQSRIIEWEKQGWKALPARRVDLVGKVGETFIVQYAGSLDALRLALAPHGWTETPKWTWKAAIPYLNPNAALADLTPRPTLHEGLKAKLTLIHPIGPEEREVLRVYKTGYTIAMRDRVEPLYMVSLTRELLRHSMNLYAIPRLAVARVPERRAFLNVIEGADYVYLLTENDVNKLKQALMIGEF